VSTRGSVSSRFGVGTAATLENITTRSRQPTKCTESVDREGMREVYQGHRRN
jgi:hypothetical protein